jgi:hypothetical protein
VLDTAFDNFRVEKATDTFKGLEDECGLLKPTINLTTKMLVDENSDREVVVADLLALFFYGKLFITDVFERGTVTRTFYPRSRTSYSMIMHKRTGQP